ncbi:hypothetical protein [Erythrobacter sp. CCH5-A1]|jgi:hypothetical protein|uniref:hypothetical protein n=1 Tax=Erythrobacter sp. CCH5-A1 TaxID=1768792 RepID=UPI00082A74BE|nr:hypothetical protein [Erythrobacter sp. CCH5-A1]
MRIGLIAAATVLAAATVSAPAWAQAGPSAIPDPATITVPDLSGGRDPAVVRDGEKYYYFWRADTSYEQAYADFADCYRFTPMGDVNAPLLPMFIAWRGSSEARDDAPAPDHGYGLVGDIMGALLFGSAVPLATQGRLRTCLEPLGYQRFPVPKATWKAMNEERVADPAALRARIASGPRPDAEPLPERR